MWRVLVALNIYCSKGAFSDCSEQVCVPPLLKDLWVTASRVCVFDPSKQVEDTPLRAPGGSPEQTNLGKNITAVEKDVMILSYCALVSKTPVKLGGGGEKSLDVSLKSLQSLCYQQWASFTKPPESKSLIKDSYTFSVFLSSILVLGLANFEHLLHCLSWSTMPLLEKMGKGWGISYQTAFFLGCTVQVLNHGFSNWLKTHR